MDFTSSKKNVQLNQIKEHRANKIEYCFCHASTCKNEKLNQIKITLKQKAP